MSTPSGSWWTIGRNGSPAFRGYMTAVSCGLLGAGMLRLVVAWLAATETASPARTLVWTIAAYYATTAILGPLAGTLADRCRTLRASLLQQGAAQALLVAPVAALAWTAGHGGAPVWLLVACSAAPAASACVVSAHRVKVTDEMLGTAGVPAGLRVYQVPANASRLLGPLLAGALLAAVSAAEVCTFIATLLVLQAALTLLPLARPTTAGRPNRVAEGPDETPSRPGWGEVIEVVWSDSRLRAVFVLGAWTSLVVGPHSAALAWQATSIYTAPASAVGVMSAALGAGMVAAALWGTRVAVVSSVPNLRWCWALMMAGLVLATVASSWWIYAAVMVPFGAAYAGTQVAGATIIGDASPSLMRGRIAALWAVVGSGPGVASSLVLGEVGDELGLRWPLVVGALVALAWLGAAAALGSRRRRAGLVAGTL